MAKSSSNSIPSPKGTRDLYPDDLLRQRYITEAWRRVSIRHGFEEIAGPTFEMLDLYKKKSGEGIVSELFSFTRAGGDDDYALRPEFTPTLARMYAAKANALPSPCKWFTAGPYFRAEKPQRGRLREFLQWNCDVIGDADTADGSLLAVAIEGMRELGLTPSDVSAHLMSRPLLAEELNRIGVNEKLHAATFSLIDAAPKISREGLVERGRAIGLADPVISAIAHMGGAVVPFVGCTGIGTIGTSDPFAEAIYNKNHTIEMYWEFDDEPEFGIYYESIDVGIHEWCKFDPRIARGLAYYTGTVFELIADGERAVAGGGRYDNLIELFGGPPTPAVGFGMGDVVLGLLLEDKGLMPEGPALMDALSQKPASLRPEAFVIANEAGEAQIEPLLAKLRRGVESEAWISRGDKKPWDADRYDVPPMHARRSYKSTKNIGKLLADARKQHAKFAVIIDSGEVAKVENLDTREDVGTFPLDQVGAKIAERL